MWGKRGSAALLFCAVVSCTQQPTALQTSHCELPAPGYSQFVSTAATSLPANYRLARLSSTWIEATLYHRFAPDALSQATRLRASQCLVQATEFLKGPDGETLSIRFADPTEPSFLPEPPMIRVVDDGGRGHLFQWQARWDCGQMVHEVMHLLGLVDEYAEPGPFPCRAVGPGDSLMVNPFQAYLAVSLGNRPSLLYPAQFRAIVYPGCGSRSSVYFQCAAGAYQAAQPNLNCGERPPACRGDSTEWIVF